MKKITYKDFLDRFEDLEMHIGMGVLTVFLLNKYKISMSVFDKMIEKAKKEEGIEK